MPTNIYLPSMGMVREHKMTKPDNQILPFNVKEASQAEYAALNQHTNRIRLERLPDDPPTPLDETIKNMQSLPPFVDARM
jgi:hypothetical protein